MQNTLTETATDSAKKDIQLLLFRVCGEEYAFALTEVREIIRTSPLTPIPSAPAYVKGIVNIRGKVLTAVDLPAFLGLPPPQNPPAFLIVAEKGNELFGFLVDSVTGVVRVGTDDLKHVPELMAAKVPAGYVESAVVSAEGAADGPAMFLVLRLRSLLDALTSASASSPL
jgi:purine-binding chemotaxis protein CheW